jgi:hypothetical protein
LDDFGLKENINTATITILIIPIRYVSELPIFSRSTVVCPAFFKK